MFIILTLMTFFIIFFILFFFFVSKPLLDFNHVCIVHTSEISRNLSTREVYVAVRTLQHNMSMRLIQARLTRALAAKINAEAVKNYLP